MPLGITLVLSIGWVSEAFSKFAPGSGSVGSEGGSGWDAFSKLAPGSGVSASE